MIRNTPPKQVQPPPKVVDREHVTGEKSAIRIAQEKGRDIILHARSWRELHEGLAGVGLQLRRKGSGAVVLVGDVAVKASSVSRHFSLAKLERRLGAFEASPFAPPEHREPEPLSGAICARQWRMYHAETDSPAKPVRQPPREAEPAPSAGETKPPAAPAPQPRMRMR